MKWNGENSPKRITIATKLIEWSLQLQKKHGEGDNKIEK